jgi:hypothetical protein
MDTILGISLGDSYSGIHALPDLYLCALKYTNSVQIVIETSGFRTVLVRSMWKIMSAMIEYLRSRRTRVAQN